MNPESSKKIRAAYGLVSIGITGFSLAIATILVCAAWFPPAEDANLIYLQWLDLGFCVVFLADFLFRKFYWKEKAAWWENLLEIGSFIPALGFIPEQLRLLRLIRVFRILSLFHRLFGRRGGHDYSQTAMGVTLFCMSMLSGFVLTYQYIEPGNFRNIVDAIYYVVVTASTVGYGDISPVSELGRVASMVLILMGIVAFSCVTAVMAAKIGGEDHRLDEICERLRKIEEKFTVMPATKIKKRNGNKKKATGR